MSFKKWDFYTFLLTQTQCLDKLLEITENDLLASSKTKVINQMKMRFASSTYLWNECPEAT